VFTQEQSFGARSAPLKAATVSGLRHIAAKARVGMPQTEDLG